MRIHKIFFFFAVLSLGWLNAYAGATQNNPVGLLQYVANGMIEGLKSNKANLRTNPAVVYQLAYRYVVPHADLAEMSKRVLPPQVWNSATPAQRLRFEKEFTRTVIRTYASALMAYQDQTIQFYPVRGSYGDTVEVNSQIVSSQTQPINVTYRLVRHGGGWRLYDMSVEGVDMLESFRSQFAELLSQGSIEQVLDQMTSHNSGHA